MNPIKHTAAAVTLAALGVTSAAHATDYQVTVTNLTSGIHFTPVLVAAHPSSAYIFRSGEHASSELQILAEGGNVGPMAALLESIGASVATGDSLLAPGASVSFTINNGSSENSRLSMAAMLLPTNDGFAGLNSVRLPEGNMTMTYNVNGYDAGTEANDEVLGSGAPGEAGFPAPPPVIASGTGTGAHGIDTTAEGFVHIHRNVIGDLDSNGGPSDINAAVHRWLNPVARVSITKISDNTISGPSRVPNLTASTYSSSSVEIFWEAASSDTAIAGYEIRRDGQLIDTLDARSFFENTLNAGTSYRYEVRAIDINGNVGESASVTVSTSS